MFNKDIFVKMPRCEYLLTIDSSLLRGPTKANFLFLDNQTFIGGGVLGHAKYPLSSSLIVHSTTRGRFKNIEIKALMLEILEDTNVKIFFYMMELGQKPVDWIRIRIRRLW